MPGLVKVGKTTQSPDARAKQLSDVSGVPFPFKIVVSIFMPDCHSAEREIHSILSEHRCSARREFFRVNPSVVEEALLEILDEQICSFLSEFAPDHSYAEADMIVDHGDICNLASKLGAQPVEVVSAFCFVRPEEYGPAIKRLRQRVEERKKARMSGDQLPPFRGQ